MQVVLVNARRTKVSPAGIPPKITTTHSQLHHPIPTLSGQKHAISFMQPSSCATSVLCRRFDLQRMTEDADFDRWSSASVSPPRDDPECHGSESDEWTPTFPTILNSATPRVVGSRAILMEHQLLQQMMPPTCQTKRRCARRRRSGRPPKNGGQPSTVAVRPRLEPLSASDNCIVALALPVDARSAHCIVSVGVRLLTTASRSMRTSTNGDCGVF